MANNNKNQDGYDSKLLDLARVTRVTSGGRRFHFRATMVIGDKNGKVGVGVDQGKDVAQAIEKATNRAEKNMISIPLTDGTIPHKVKAKYGAAEVMLKPQTKGRGLVAGGAIRTIANLGGIEDISSKILGNTRNKLNIARAAIKGLKKLHTPKDVSTSE
ncbi:MAG: 30S ribosomal protein S5 [Candidatus Paceibacterota bacterium]